MNTNALWVGQKGTELLVHDPNAQVAGSDLVVLWNKTTQEVELYKRDILRKNVATVSDSQASEEAISLYTAWLSNSRPLLEEERDYLRKRIENEKRERAEKEERERQKIEREKLEKLSGAERAQLRHAAYFEGKGLKNPGVRPRGILTRHRVAHCYSCKHPLDNSIDIECVACGWIICGCGACGCGYGL
jgi:hypothetical protein